jgi:hypothetical protein
MDALSAVPDPRCPKGRRHPLPAVLALLSVAVMCGRRSVYAALQWGRDQGREMAAKLGLGKHGIPSDGMMSNLPRRLDRQAFEAALSRWAGGWEGGVPRPDELPLEVTPIDGKALRGSQGHEVPGVHLLAAYAARLGIVLKQVPAGANKQDGGEILAAPQVLEGLVLRGRVITGDAIHARRELCRQIVDQGGHYLLTTKENQPSPHRERVDLFRSPCAPLCPRSRRTSTAQE